MKGCGKGLVRGMRAGGGVGSRVGGLVKAWGRAIMKGEGVEWG